MSKKEQPSSTPHEEQMALARQFQAERRPNGTTKPRNSGRGHVRETSHANTTSVTTRASTAHYVNTTAIATQSSVTRGSHLTSSCGPFTSTATLGNENAAQLRTGGGGVGLSTSRWAFPPYPDHIATQKSVHAKSTSNQESVAYSDPMEIDQPAATTPTATQPTPQSPSNPASVVPGPTAGRSLSQHLVEPSLLDEDVPMVENMEEPIRPTRFETMCGRRPSLSASRWAPQHTLDGREIKD